MSKIQISDMFFYAAEVGITPYYSYFLSPAMRAGTGMNTNNSSAFRAGPCYFFTSNKFLNTNFFNGLKIFKQAHIVSGSISYIQMFQNVAGTLFTFKTESCFSFLK